MSGMDSEIVVTDDQLPADVLDAVVAGNKIVAIKRLRAATGLGLANAKVLVDRAAARHGSSKPRQSGFSEDKGLNPLFALLLLAIVAFVVYRYYLAV